MKYDFDTIVERKDTSSLKWDLFKTDFPMWVADMDFLVAPEIIEALEKRVKHGIFGYAIIPDAYYESYINWWQKRHDLIMKKEEMLFSVGVMPSISSMIRELTCENDGILIQTPVYHIFFKVIEDNNRQIIENQLSYDGKEYSINFDDLEDKLSQEDTKMMLLCNPHNPVGRIWTKEELQRIDELCKRYNVIIISDEIHCDLINPDKSYVPFENVSDNKDNVITCLAPTKTFNIAGIQSSIIHIQNRELYGQIQNRLIVDDSSQINVFSIVATVTAFNECEEWLNQLNQYIFQNKLIVDEFLKKEIPSVKLVKSEATYLLWLDCTELNIKSRELNDFMNSKFGLYFSPGVQFGENGDNFLRINVACPKKMLLEALERFKEGINILLQK